MRRKILISTQETTLSPLGSVVSCVVGAVSGKGGWCAFQPPRGNGGTMA